MSENEEKKDVKSVMARPVSKKKEEEYEKWLTYIEEVQQKTPERFEDAAKFLTTIISLSLTLLLAMGGGRTLFQAHPQLLWIKVAVLLWLMAVLMAFVVLLPVKYRYFRDEEQGVVAVDTIKKLHRKAVMWKRFWLITSFVSFLVGLVILSLIFVLS